MFPYINLLHDILKDQDPFPFIRMPSQPPGARPPDSRGAFGPRQDQDPRACDRGVRRMLTCMAHHPVDNSILHGMRRFTRRPVVAVRKTGPGACYTSAPRFRQHRTQHRTRPASASIAPSTERAPLPSDPNAPLSPSNAPIRPNAPRYPPLPPGKAPSTSWYQQLTRTYIAPKPSIMRNKG